MTTTVSIKFNLPEIAAEMGDIGDVHGIASDAVHSVARRLEQGDTAGSIYQRYVDNETGLLVDFRAALFEVVDGDGRAVTDLHAVVE